MKKIGSLTVAQAIGLLYRRLLVGFCIGGLLLLPILSHAQTKSPTPVRVTAGDVTDNRSTGSAFSECKVELKFTGDPAADASTVRNVHVTEAVDEVGRDLKKNEEDAASHFFSSGNSSGALKTEITLKNPSRNATVIKVLKGEAELFSPTEANGAILHIPNALGHPAEPMQNPVLAKYGIELIYLTKESYEAKKKQMESSGNSGGALGSAFSEMFSGMFGGMMSDSKDSIQLYIKDPGKRIIDLEFQDAQGTPLKTGGSMSTEQFRRIGLRSPPPADAQLRVQLAVPEAVKSCTFELHDIPLP